MKLIQQTTKERNIMYLLIAVTSFFIGFLIKKPDIIVNVTKEYEWVKFPNGERQFVTYRADDK